LGPQILKVIPPVIIEPWSNLPKYLITIVFAGLFLGRILPDKKELWRQAGPQIAFGSLIAWGQYVVGLILTIFILTPVFGANPMTAALIEISFEGGHGTAAGLSDTFNKLGFYEGTDIALALATLSIFSAIVAGILIINWHNKKSGATDTIDDQDKRSRQSVRSGYSFANVGKKFKTSPQGIVLNTVAFPMSIGIGWLILKFLIFSENILVGTFTSIRFFPFVPLFPLAMIGGLIVQLTLRKMYLEEFIQRRTAETFSAIALDFLIVCAISTISLKTIGDNFAILFILGTAGIIWIIGGFFFFAPKMFPRYWFEKGIADVGQSLGTTATGLMLQRLADPTNTSRSKESFAYKQLFFEPLMGGGLITASSVIIIYEFGVWTLLIISLGMMVFWYVLGTRMSKKRKATTSEYMR
jgi:ESS family glutamate:Na+ symporter